MFTYYLSAIDSKVLFNLSVITLATSFLKLSLVYILHLRKTVIFMARSSQHCFLLVLRDIIACLANLFWLFNIVNNPLLIGNIATVFVPVGGTEERDSYQRIDMLHYANVIIYCAQKIL